MSASQLKNRPNYARGLMDTLKFPIRISSPKQEGILQVSKWLKVQVLLDSFEMQDLLNTLGEVFFVTVSEPITARGAVITPEFFLRKYTDYVDLLKQGQVPKAEDFRQVFSSALTSTLDPFYAITTSSEKFLIKPTKPVIQLQAHHFFYSDLDHKFHPMVLSSDSISWGLQFSYPQLFQDPIARKVIKVTDTLEFPNTALYSKLMKWMRNATLSTPFVVKEARTNSPIRIGKKALAWIANHPQLKMKGIQIFQLGIR